MRRRAAGARSTQRILVPVDGSKNSLRALAYVAARVRTDNRSLRLIVLNVQPRMPRGTLVTGAMVDEHYERQSEAALRPARRLLERYTVSAEVRVLIGDPAASIVEFARSARCSEIVVGTRGLGSLKGLLLGSVTTKVIHLSPIPVTAVP